MLQYMRSRVKSFPMLSRIAIVYEVILIRIREVTRFLRALHRAVVLFTPATGRKIQRNCRPSDSPTTDRHLLGIPDIHLVKGFILVGFSRVNTLRLDSLKILCATCLN